MNATRLPDGRLQGIARDLRARKRAENALRRAVCQQQAVAELGQRALGRSDLQRLMEDAVTLVAAGLDTSYAKVLELLPSEAALRLRAAVGWSPALVGNALVPATRASQAGFTLLSGSAVVVEDLTTETRFRGPVLTADEHLVSGLSVVIRGAAQPFGVLGVHGLERRHVTPDDVHFVEAVANVLGQAVVRAEADDALHTSELRYRLAARATHDAMYDWDIANDRMFWSEGMELLFGHAPGAVGPGLDWWKDYIYPDDRDAMLTSVMETLRAGLQVWRSTAFSAPTEPTLRSAIAASSSMRPTGRRCGPSAP